MHIRNPEDPAVEFGVVLSNTTVFYTGGFDEVPTRSNTFWKQGINGTFVNSRTSPWYITYIDPTHVVAVIDYRKKN